VEWINELQGKTVGFDTAPLIYFIEVHNIRTPDAIQLSAALDAGATHFFTNDIRLPVIPSIQILSLDSLI
jgi:hypothetical protein